MEIDRAEPMPEPFITIAEAARKTGVNYQTLRRLAYLGRVPSVTVAGIRRLRLSQIQACIAERCNAEEHPCQAS